MDLWVVVAAAGAGYLAKYLKRLSKNGDSSSRLSSEDSNFENPESPSSSFRRQAGRDQLGKDVYLDRKASGVDSLDGLWSVEFASSRGHDCEKLRRFRNYNEGDLSSSGNENFNDIEDGNERSFDIGGSYGLLLPHSSAGEVGSIHNYTGNKISLSTKHLCGHIKRPLNSIESCLMAQLCKEHAKLEEEYVFISALSPSTATRSFLVSDGNRIISRADDDEFATLIGSEEYKLHKEACQVKDGNVFGVPSLAKIGSCNEAKRMKFNAGYRQSRRLSSSNDVFSGKPVNTQCDATFLFSLGISFGIITSIMANKREMDQLRGLLKQTENLVQDLQEELEMKDSMTVKELHNENYGSQDTYDHSFCDKELSGFSPEKHMDNSPIIDCKESCDQKDEEYSESMSKIEAELEAELERLGLNMNASSLDRRLSELVEILIELVPCLMEMEVTKNGVKMAPSDLNVLKERLYYSVAPCFYLYKIDPEFEADFAQGELRADMVSGKDFDHSKSNENASDTTTPSVNYAVSPRELSLRLHEVIQSRLEERVNELEIALQNSQSKVWSMESAHECRSRKYFPSHGQESSFTREKNILTYDDSEPTMSQPLVMNLSGEALGAYNEAYEELIKLDEFEENSPPGIHDTNCKVGSRSHDWPVSGVQHGGANGSVSSSNINGERLSREISSGDVVMLEGQSSSIYELNVSRDENCDFDYDCEVESQLIRQIVERTKKGSPVYQNAQRILYSMDEDEH